MTHKLEFEKLVRYDAGQSGISINVELRLGNVSTRFKAKIDTGASFCIFERDFGEKLGIDIESGAPRLITTATGNFRVFGHWLTLVTEEFEFDSDVYFAENVNFNKNVLGRYGWLDRVIIGINDYDGKLYLSGYKSE